MMQRIRKAVFPVGGLGTRFLPMTKAMPKEMLPVVDKPLIQYAVEEAQAAGIEHFIFVTGRGKNIIEDHFDFAPELERALEEKGKTMEIRALNSFMPRSGQISFTRQREALGLGHAVWCARDLVGDDPFAVLLPDDIIKAETPCLKQMVAAYEKTGGNIVAAMDVPREKTGSYGILDVESDDGHLVSCRGLVEKPAPESAPSTLSIIGRYILTPGIFSLLENGERGAGGEIQLTDAMARMMKDKPLHGMRFEGKRYDCGNKAGFIQANIAYALSDPDMADSVCAAFDEENKNT